jgi:hypothetical protein
VYLLKKVMAFAILAVCFQATPLRAEPAKPSSSHKPTIYSTAWGVTLSLDGTGFYNDIAYDILDHLAQEPLYRIRPFRRAKVSFFGNRKSCLYPTSLSALAAAGQIKDPENFVESDGLFSARTHLFVRAGETPPKSLADLFGKTVAYANGSVVRSMLEGHGARLISVNDEADKAEMLRSGRVDVISGMLPDAAIVFANLGGDMPAYDPDFVLYDVDVTIVCHKTPATEALIKNVNAALETLSADAEFVARLMEARVILGAMARGSGDASLVIEDELNALAPSAGGRKWRPEDKGDKSKRTNAGRRVLNHPNH